MSKSFLKQFARLIGVREYQAEDALTNERAAKLTLSRRSFLGVSSALVVGTAFGFYKQLGYLPWNHPDYVYLALEDEEGNSYERLPIKRTEEHWHVKGDKVELIKDAIFPAATHGNLLATRTAIYGADGRLVVDRLYVHPPIRIVSGVTPILNASSGPYGAWTAR